MTDAATLRAVADAGGSWRDDVDVVTTVADPDRLLLLSELLGGPPHAAAVPPLWTSVLPAPWVGYDALGVDGHPMTGVGLPPLPDRRRLYAGGRLTLHGELAVGATVTRTSRVGSARVVDGRSGPLLFVGMEHSFTDAAGDVVVSEEVDLAYRCGPAAAPPPAGAADAGAAELRLSPDAVTLFRFSALTANAHRIHYDERYAVEVEGLPGRLVHGPLVALLMLELPRRIASDRPVATYSYRLSRPVALGATLEARRTHTSPTTWEVAATADGVRCADGVVTFGEGGAGR